MAKKTLKFIILISIAITTLACTKQENYEKYNYIVLTINMPLTYEDLDTFYENSLKEILEKEYIGEVTGDKIYLNKDQIPCKMDIEFEIRETKIKDFKKLIKNYILPKYSYISYNKTEEDLNGTLEGLEIKITNMNNTNEIYEELKEEINNKNTYITSHKKEEKVEIIYIYTSELETINNKLNKFLKIKEIENNVTINKITNYCE